jgi:hypothetical protein
MTTNQYKMDTKPEMWLCLNHPYTLSYKPEYDRWVCCKCHAAYTEHQLIAESIIRKLDELNRKHEKDLGLSGIQIAHIKETRTAQLRESILDYLAKYDKDAEDA